MLTKTLTLSAVVFASGIALAAPGAYAGSPADDPWSRFNSTDGGGNVSADLPDRPKAAPTPEQAAQLRYFEAQRQMSDGNGNTGASLPDTPKVAPTPEQAAQLRYFEAQRQITDGAGDILADHEGSNTPATPTPGALARRSSGQ